MDIKTKIWQAGASLARFIQYVAVNFVYDDCIYRASALTFASLLAIVPLMSVSLTVFSSFPVFKAFSSTIQDFIFENFVPATGKMVQQYLQNFTAQAAKLSIPGVIFLCVTAILVMFTVESALNEIWKVKVRRHGIAAFLLYWAILSLSPLLLGFSVALSSYIISLPLISDSTQAMWLYQSLLLTSAPFLFSVISFMLLYMVVPNCNVNVSHGASGAIVAAILFEISKNGFVFYLARIHTYQLLYGAFAIAPIFFLWVYWVWVIILLGAEVAHALSVHYNRRQGRVLDGFSHAFRWVGYLWQAQQHGNSLSIEQLINDDNYRYAISPEMMMEQLIEAKLVRTISDNQFMLSRDLSDISLRQFYQWLPWKFPDSQVLEVSDNRWEHKLSAVIKRLEDQGQPLLNTRLSAIYRIE